MSRFSRNISPCKWHH